MRVLPVEAAAIREALAAGESLRSVARRFKRSPSHIAAIRDGAIHRTTPKPPAPTLAERVASLEERVAALEAKD